ncbi:MAG: anti-sigma F factor [Oscillospiraceae bacterium]|nr:anti-sigma F factor [Oscillospiraceae bacterium]
MLNELKMEFDSRSVNEGLARSAISQFAAQLDPTLEELGDIKTAVSEAVTNAIVHAYPEHIGRVWLRVRVLEGGVLELVVRDRGVGIPNLDEARLPMYTTGGADRAGMGFTIMDSFMDTLKVRSDQGKGTTVTMRRRVLPRSFR